MDFRRLQAFARVYELQNFSKAGKALFLSQPTISSHVLSLEDELGVRLFDRIGRSVIPTQAGQVLYSGVRKIFLVLEQTKADIHDLKKEVCGQVVVGGSTIPSNYLLPAVLSDFRNKYPRVCVDLRIGDSIRVCRDVLEGELDFGIVGGFAHNPDLETDLLMQDRLHIVARTDIAAGLSPTVSLDDLKTLPWVMREKGSGTRQAFEDAMISQGVALQDLNITTLVQSTEALVRCILAGAGLGVTSHLAVGKYVEAGDLKILDIGGLNIKRNFHIIRHRRRSLFTCSSRLIQCIREHIRNNGYQV